MRNLSDKLSTRTIMSRQTEVGWGKKCLSYSSVCPPQDMSTSTSTSTSTLSIEFTRRAVLLIVPTFHYMLGDGGLQCSAAAVLDARSRREAARLGP